MFFCIIFLGVRSKTQWFYTLFCLKYPRFPSLAPALLAEISSNKYVLVCERLRLTQSFFVFSPSFFRAISLKNQWFSRKRCSQYPFFSLTRVALAEITKKYRYREMHQKFSVCKRCVYRSFLLKGLIVPLSLWFWSNCHNTSSMRTLYIPTLHF